VSLRTLQIVPHITTWQEHAPEYPTLAKIALDVLAIPASSVPCERLFSAAKHIATDHRARLGSERFEELQIMKSVWRSNIHDLAAWNSDNVKEVDLTEFEEQLREDKAAAAWDDEYPTYELYNTVVVE